MIIDQKLLESIDFIIEQTIDGSPIGHDELNNYLGFIDIKEIDKLIQYLEIPLLRADSGYRFDGGVGQPLNTADIKSHLVSTSSVDIAVKRLVTSTNELLLAQVENSIEDYSIVVSESQAYGRGRQQKQWFSPYGGNVYFSLGFKTERVDHVYLLPLLVAVTLRDLLVRHGVDGLQLKWPNDVLINGKKLAGILVESKVCGENQFVVIGIGINIVRSKQILASVDQPVAFLDDFQATKMIDRNLLVAMLIENLIKVLENPVDDMSLISAWSEADAFKGRSVEVMLSGQWKQGLAVGVADKGQYVIEMETGKVEINSSYVSLRLAE